MIAILHELFILSIKWEILLTFREGKNQNSDVLFLNHHKDFIYFQLMWMFLDINVSYHCRHFSTGFAQDLLIWEWKIRLDIKKKYAFFPALSLPQSTCNTRPAPELRTGVLLIYIITNVPIPLYQVNYAPYLILILLWEPGSVSVSLPVTTDSPLYLTKLYPLLSGLRTASVCDSDAVCLRRCSSPLSGQQRHCCFILILPRGNDDAELPPAEEKLILCVIVWCREMRAIQGGHSLFSFTLKRFRYDLIKC